MNDTALVQTTPMNPELAKVEADKQRFELAQRQANIYAKSSLVPKHYQNQIGNVMIATNMASRMNADVLMVMQNLYIVHGNPGWSASFLIGTFNQCGRFSSLKYRFKGEPHTDSWGCQAYCTELATGEEVSGTWITWEMATSEGWVAKAGSKWRTMPEQMFRYRAAVFLIRATAPEIGLGLPTADELQDIAPIQIESPTETLTGVEAVKAKLVQNSSKDTEQDPAEDEIAEVADVIEAEPVIDESENVPEESSENHEKSANNDLDPATEDLRASVQERLASLSGSIRKNLIAGKPLPSKMNLDELKELDKAIAEHDA